MKRLLLLSLLVALLALPGALPAAANSSSGAGGLLSELRPPEGQELVLTAIGRGSQNYVCDQATSAWIFRTRPPSSADTAQRSASTTPGPPGSCSTAAGSRPRWRKG